LLGLPFDPETEAIQFAETSIKFYRTTRRHIREDGILYDMAKELEVVNFVWNSVKRVVCKITTIYI
jgi:hypothetical protein